MRRIFITIIAIVCIHFSWAQDVKVEGQFLEDSVELGKPLHFVMVARYKENKHLFFPDSTYQFSPFELIEKKYFPTITKDSISRDSVIYVLRSFELDSVQSLRLPAYMINYEDTTKYFTYTDFLFFKSQIPNVSDSELSALQVKSNTSFYDVFKEFNTLFMVGIIVLVFLLLVVCWVVFRKKIYKYFAEQKLHKEHRNFIEKFDQSVRLWNDQHRLTDAEKALTIWKVYIEKILDIPISKLTSKEIKRVIQDDHLNQCLAVIDGAIYGKIIPEGNPYGELKSISIDKYYQKLEQLKYGK